MKQRIITAAIGICIILPCIIFSNTIIFDIFIALCCAIATFEIINCTRKIGNSALTIPSLLLAFVIPFLVRRFEIDYTKLILVFSVIYFIYVISLSLFSKGKFKITDATIIVCMVIYMLVGFTSLIYIRDVVRADDGTNVGIYYLLAALLSAWIPDSGAYFVGIKYGKTKLIPDVSPKKTVEGLLGGIATNVLVFIIYSIVINTIFNVKLNAILLILLSILLTLVSVIGDLLASLVKRYYNIKDYGNLLPGHGGIMDRFDSVLSTSLVTFVIVLLIYC